MTIKAISYSQSRETINSMGLKSWHKYSVDAELGESEDPMEASEKLCALVHSMHSTNGTNTAPPMPSLYSQPQAITAHSIDRKAIERLEILIDECKTIAELEMFAKDSESLGLARHFYSKKQQLLDK